MTGRVTGKMALVTGGAQGLGRAHCIRLAQEGARVLATDINGAGAEETAALINAERDTKDCITLLDQVMKLLSTYETTTVTFAGCSLIFALFVIIRQFKL